MNIYNSFIISSTRIKYTDYNSSQKVYHKSIRIICIDGLKHSYYSIFVIVIVNYKEEILIIKINESDKNIAITDTKLIWAQIQKQELNLIKKWENY